MFHKAILLSTFINSMLCKFKLQVLSLILSFLNLFYIYTHKDFALQGIKFGFSRSFCDDTFHFDTMSICEFKAPLFNSLCKSLASFMSFSVRMMGEKRYKWVYPEPWCDLPEVRHCVPPIPLKID